MKPIMSRNSEEGGFNQFLAYVQKFNVMPQNGVSNAPNAYTGMYSLRRALRPDGRPQKGYIVPVKYFRAPVMLIPRHGSKADIRLTKTNSLELCNDFWLNDYINKDFYLSMRIKLL